MRKNNYYRTINSEDINTSVVALNDNVLKNFKKLKATITIPPNSRLRDFNENDILGDFDRDEKGNVIVLQDKNGQFHDK